MNIHQQINEMLKLKDLKPTEEDMLTKFRGCLAQMEVLSPGQIKWVAEKYQSFKRQRRVGQSAPYYKKYENATNWDSIGGAGLKKQTDLLGVSSFWGCVKKVKKMGSEERKAWFKMANEVAELQV